MWRENLNIRAYRILIFRKSTNCFLLYKSFPKVDFGGLWICYDQ